MEIGGGLSFFFFFFLLGMELCDVLLRRHSFVFVQLRRVSA
jgi:hypothetical protein